MPVVLSPNIHDEIFEKVKLAFVDFPLFDQIVGKQLKQLISDTNTIDIDAKSLRKLTEKYFDIDSFKTEQQKLILQQIHLILRTAYVVVLSYQDNVKPLLWNDINKLLENYPQFQGQDEDELKYLLTFRNYLRVSLLIIPARLNKQLLLKIAAKLEGSRNEYITGGGQKPCVTRRVEIYEQEGNIQPEKRQDRIRPPTMPGKKRQGNNPLKDLKLLRLPSEEVRALTKAPAEAQPKSKHKNAHRNKGPTNGSHSNGTVGGNPIDFLPPNHPFAQMPMHYYPYPYPYYNGQMPPPPPGNFMDFPPSFGNINNPNFSNIFDDNIVTESMDDLLAFGATPRTSNNNTSAAANGEFSYNNDPINLLPSSAPTVTNTTNATTNKEENSKPLNVVLPSSTFAPGLNREQSELIDRLLLPESEFWQGNNNNNSLDPTTPTVNHPLHLMREISWDIYNGTFENDLKNIFGPEW
mmetsp:Transcript_1731/g.1813  ORF Transcript_1731/g.1813 Transcript_1731/m.1813 type:complete len:465 (-) Transcript_1731:345-1739(-)